MMGSAPLPPLLSSCSHLVPPGLPSLGLNIEPRILLKNLKKKRWSHHYGNSSRVQAYYGVTAPPYGYDALEPYMSKRTLKLHWAGHHYDYVESLNKQLKGNSLYGCTLEQLIKTTYNNGNPLPEFNNAAATN